MLRCLLSLVPLLACFGCSSARHPDLPKTERLTIAHHKVTCEGEGRRLCLLATKANGEQTLIYDAIKGFDFQWGQRASITVRMEEVPNPPADGSSIRMTLAQVIKTTPDASRFKLLLRAGDIVQGPNGSTLLGDIKARPAKHDAMQPPPALKAQETQVPAWLEDGVLVYQAPPA